MTFKRITGFAFVAAALFASAQIMAEDLGVIGKVYPIAEQDAVEQIKEKLTAMQKNGELDKLQHEAVARSMNTLKNPKPNDSIKTATSKSVKYFDPTQTFDHEVRSEDGRLISPAGRKINPLDYMTLTKVMVFFDGRDKAQTAAVKALVKREGDKIKPILTAGSWYDISKDWGRQVYYDQGGYLTQRLTVEQVPAVIAQDGKQLKITYTPANELK